jgi:hypothetical protein
MLPPGYPAGCCSIECANIATNVAWRGIPTKDGGVEVTDIVIGDMKRSRVHDRTEVAVVAGPHKLPERYFNHTETGRTSSRLPSVPPADLSQAELRVFCQQLVDSAPTGLFIETLAKYAGITVEQARAYRERLLAKWPLMKAYMDAQAKRENFGLPTGLGEPKISPPPEPPRAFKKGTFFPPETIASNKRGNTHTKRNQVRSKKGRGC